MTGVVLALAALTCGEGGPGMKTATAPVAVDFDGEWEGVIHFRDREGEVQKRPVRISWGRPQAAKSPAPGAIFVSRMPGMPTWVLVADGPRCVTVVREDRDARDALQGIWKLERGRLVVCFARSARIPRPREFWAGPDTYLFTLHPAAPRKP